MRIRKTLIAALGASLLSLQLGAAPLPAIPAPQDRDFGGEIRLHADASDIDRRIVHVRETITQPPADLVLLYPQWLPGVHAPAGQIDKIAGLSLRADGKTISWQRNPLDVFAIHVAVPPGTDALEIEFDYLSPTSDAVAAAEISRDVMMLEWPALVFYPAGHYAQRIPVTASLTLPVGWSLGTALQVAHAEGARSDFAPTDLETLIDSPVYAGRHARRIDLDPGSKEPVFLNIFADRPSSLEASDAELAAHRNLVRQADRLYGARHFAHYDFLLSLSDQIGQIGLEHHQSSENGQDPDYFRDRANQLSGRDLLGHEYTHSWNGKFRRPAGLWTPNYNVPMQGSLLWVYEGQTQYWGQVLTARSGIWSAAEARDSLASVAAYFEDQAGRSWRALADTTSDPIMNPRSAQSWPTWQRFADYYSEAQLIWLDADTLIRERSGGRRSLDDFARAFFGVENGRVTPLTYTREDVVKTLDQVEHYDWDGFLEARIYRAGSPAPLDGITRGGYSLVYQDTPNALDKSDDGQRKVASFRHSIGFIVRDEDSTLAEVTWGRAAFKAGLTEGMTLLAVNGSAYTRAILEDALREAQKSAQPIELIVRVADRYRVVSVDYHEGLRYPHLVRNARVPARLDDILKPR